MPILIGPIAVDGCEWNREPSRACDAMGMGNGVGVYIGGGAAVSGGMDGLVRRDGLIVL